MNCQNKICIFIILISILLTHTSFASLNHNPCIINIYKDKYHGENKNWAIAEDEKGFLYFGNDGGVLIFDGIEWEINQTPNNQPVRSVAVLSHNTIFTGSYEEFGRWDRDVSGKLKYTSLSDKLDKATFKNNDFWKIWIAKDCVYFQSFSSIYMYDYNTVKRITADIGFLFLTKVRDKFLVQQMQGKLYSLSGTKLETVKGSEIFENTDVRVILPYSDNEYLIGTSTKGVFVYDGENFRELSTTLSAIMKDKELNCGILTSRQTYLFGTILDGIYEVDADGRVIRNISSKNNLQNNTVLALHEDNLKNIWIALDRGLGYIKYTKNIKYYLDPNGGTGAVYDAIEWNNKLFLATNQGVFYIHKKDLSNPNALSYMNFIDGSQGQVWSFNLIDDRLYYCHNIGIKEIHKDLHTTNPFYISGTYDINPTQINGKKVWIVSTYTSLMIIDRENNSLHNISEISEPIKKSEIDHLGNIWLEHANRGIYRCKIADNLKQLTNCSYYGGNNKDGLPYKLKMFKVGGRIVLLGDDKFYTYDDISDKIVPDDLLNLCFKNIRDIKLVIPIQNNLFWALTKTSLYKFSYDGYKTNIIERYEMDANLSSVYLHENISILNDSTNLICLDNGFLIYNNKDNTDTSGDYSKPHNPYFEALEATDMNGEKIYIDMSNRAEIPYKYNSISFTFSANGTFGRNYTFQYKLSHVDQDWSVAKKTSKVNYVRLPKGEYTFMIRTVDNFGNHSEPILYKFKISPPWYQSIWAYMLYLLLLILSAYITWMLILKRYRNLHLQKIRYRETKRLRILAGKLQDEVERKNAELLTQTSFIIRKNELILKIKDIVDEFYAKNKTNALLPVYQKINTVLNTNIDSENDWKMFLIKFEDKHTGFFKKLKSEYPQLTSSDLRLCACLKLNLETKEIASLMNLSVRAVENSRYRLRKKLDIKPTQNLNEFFLNI